MSTQQFIAKNTFMVALLLGASSILGVIRESAIAYQFGATGTTDAYLIAMIIPTLFINLIRASVTNTFITVYGERLAKGDVDGAWRMANIIISLFLIALAILVALFFLIAPALVHLFAPKYEGWQFGLSVELTQILLPSIFFGGVMGIFVGINNSHHSFLIPSAVWPLANLFVITSIFALGPVLGIKGLAIGTLMGSLAQLLIQLPTARKHGWRYFFSLDIRDPGVKETFWLVTPFLISAGASQVNLIIDRTLATGLPEGIVSALYFANKLVFLPQSVFTAALGMVVFPLLVRSAARGDWAGVVDGVFRAVRLLSLILLPAMMGIYVLRFPLVRLLFEHGVFTREDTWITAATIPYFLGALFFGGLVLILMNIYFATKKMVVAVGTGVISLGVNIFLSFLLIEPMEQKGLALANSVSAFVNFALLAAGLFIVLGLHKKAKIPIRESRSFAWQIMGSVLVMGIVIWLYQEGTGLMDTQGKAVRQTLGAVGLGAFVYGLMLYIFKVEEIELGLKWIGRKMKGF